MWCAAELGVPVERIDVGGKFGGNKESAYLKLNPNGVVPTLIDRATVVWESNTILRYLCNTTPGTLYPAAAPERQEVERWMDWQLTEQRRVVRGQSVEVRRALGGTSHFKK